MHLSRTTNVHAPPPPPRADSEILSIAFPRNADPHHFNLNPDMDLVFHFNADPDPAFHLNADPNPDPAPYSLIKVTVRYRFYVKIGRILIRPATKKRKIHGQ
jgi:hypothetical protein